MDSETKGWLTFGIAALFIVAASLTTCEINRTHRLAEMVQAGADVSAASCALGGHGSANSCIRR